MLMTQRISLYAAAAGVVWVTYLLYALASRRPPARARIRHSNVKYILLWTPWESPLNLIEEGLSSFQNNNCNFTNCYVTDNKYFLADFTYFDAVAFNGKDLTKWIWLPGGRSQHQKYIFAAAESSHNYPVCDSVYEGFFNWTWTYKLDSDVRWGYVTVYDGQGREVGPRKDMAWADLKPVNDELKRKLSGKTKGAAWFVSNCHTEGKREEFYEQLWEFLPAYEWTVDMFGECGTRYCPRDNEQECHKMVEDDYHFYFSFENSFSDGYVTEKLLTALNHYAIPVVYGGANYSQFLPPGSYLDARELGPKKLLETMDEIIHDKPRFYDFFRWRNHYSYKNTLCHEDLCNLCAALNDEALVRRHSVHNDFRRWWNDGRCGT